MGVITPVTHLKTANFERYIVTLRYPSEQLGPRLVPSKATLKACITCKKETDFHMESCFHMFSRFEGQETQETHVDKFGPSGAKKTRELTPPKKGGHFKRILNPLPAAIFQGPFVRFRGLLHPGKSRWTPKKCWKTKWTQKGMPNWHHLQFAFRGKSWVWPLPSKQ